MFSSVGHLKFFCHHFYKFCCFVFRLHCLLLIVDSFDLRLRSHSAMGLANTKPHWRKCNKYITKHFKTRRPTCWVSLWSIGFMRYCHGMLFHCFGLSGYVLKFEPSKTLFVAGKNENIDFEKSNRNNVHLISVGLSSFRFLRATVLTSRSKRPQCDRSPSLDRFGNKDNVENIACLNTCKHQFWPLTIWYVWALSVCLLSEVLTTRRLVHPTPWNRNMETKNDEKWTTLDQ